MNVLSDLNTKTVKMMSWETFPIISWVSTKLISSDEGELIIGVKQGEL